MRILLLDTDSKIPNIALAKLSTFHKNRDDTVTLKQLEFSGYPASKKPKIIDAKNFDRVYVSTIFTYNNHLANVTNCRDVHFGGTGNNINSRLPEGAEYLPMDYSIYPESDTSYGFLTRGCIRKCKYCLVPEKEGALHKYNSIDQIFAPGHRKVKFLDNNFLAHPDHEEVLKELIERKIKCTFSQGLDIRFLNKSNLKLLEKLRYIEEYIFAFDDIKLEKIINEKMKLIKKCRFKGRLKFFIFMSPGYTTLSDDVYRIKWCIKNNVLPYVMREHKCWESEFKNFYIDIAAWCNQPNLFKKMNFDTFLMKRYPNNLFRQMTSNAIYSDYHPEMAA